MVHLRRSSLTAYIVEFMSRQTYSLSAAAFVAFAGLSLSNADGAVVVAQDAAALVATETDPAAPTVEPIEVVPNAPVFIAQEVVQEIPESPPATESFPESSASSLRELVSSMDRGAQLGEQMRCLAGAVYFESRGEPLAGQLAVAQVIINRAEDRRWPSSYCGVVYQRSQFSFVRGGRMPSINTSSSAWHRAKAVAQIADADLWESEAADAVYFHANYVRPRWSRSKTRVTQIDTHVFYR